MTTALEAWKQRIIACRRQRSQTDSKQWDRTAGWYDSWVQENDYVDRVFPYLQEALPADARVLEIGSGTGAFTLPLARAAREVLAIEPSQVMREHLDVNLQAAGLSNVNLLSGRIEESLPDIRSRGPFQLIFASFSLYNITDIDLVISNLLPLTRHLMILLGTGAPSIWSQDLYRQFSGEERVIPPQLDLLYPVLLEMGLYADVRILNGSQNYLYANEQALVDWWMERLKLPPSRRRELQDALRPLILKRDDQVGIFRERKMALVDIDREKQNPKDLPNINP
jgi:SAM-dependent methyltransferase